MHALCVFGAVNTQGFVWKFFMRYIIYIFIHSLTKPLHLPVFAAGVAVPVAGHALTRRQWARS